MVKLLEFKSPPTPIGMNQKRSLFNTHQIKFIQCTMKIAAADYYVTKKRNNKAPIHINIILFFVTKGRERERESNANIYIEAREKL